MNKVFKYNCTVRIENVDTFVKCERKAVKTSAQNAVLKALLESLAVLKIHCFSSVADVAELGGKEQRVTAEIVEKAFGFVVNLTDKLVCVCNLCAASD